MTLAKEPLPLLDDYPQQSGWYDEAVDDDGTIRPARGGAMRALAGRDLEELAVAVERHGADEGVVFHSAVGDEVFVIDPVPRVIAAAEWARDRGRPRPARARAQRVRAPTSTASAGSSPRASCPQRVIDDAEYFEPGMQGVEPPGGLWIGIAGLDLVRDADGRFRVLEDNVRTPSGFAYAAAARRALVAHLEVPPGRPPAHARRPAGDAVARAARGRRTDALAARRRCSPTARTTRPTTSTSGRPSARRRRWSSRTGSTSTRVDVVYRRTNADRLDTERRRAAARAAARGPRRGRQRVRHRGRRTTSSRTPMSRT